MQIGTAQKLHFFKYLLFFILCLVFVYFEIGETTVASTMGQVFKLNDQGQQIIRIVNISSPL